jgi:hypothetical protein
LTAPNQYARFGGYEKVENYPRLFLVKLHDNLTTFFTQTLFSETVQPPNFIAKQDETGVFGHVMD